jgi:hypothetical protein
MNPIFNSKAASIIKSLIIKYISLLVFFFIFGVIYTYLYIYFQPTWESDIREWMSMIFWIMPPFWIVPTILIVGAELLFWWRGNNKFIYPIVVTLIALLLMFGLPFIPWLSNINTLILKFLKSFMDENEIYIYVTYVLVIFLPWFILTLGMYYLLLNRKNINKQ